MGFILFIVASILWIPVTITNLIVVLVKNAKRRGFFRVLNEFFMSTAMDIDRFGNHNFRAGLNTVMIKENSENTFGNWNETISSVLGKNQRDDTLTPTGKFLCGVLDFIDEDHCKKSIKE